MKAALDFGASATKAAVLDEGGRSRPVLVDGAEETSSAVFLHRDGRLLSGLAALNSAQRRPHRLQGALKRRINRPDAVEPVHQEVEFDAGTERPLVRCVAAVIGSAWQAILRETGGTAVPLLLTHPVGWGEPQRAALLEACALAGVRPAALVSEAEAVGWHVWAARRPAGPLLVVDLGASTLDLAVLAADGSGRLDVEYSDGDNYLGGDDFDREVLELVAAALADDPQDAALLAEFTEFCDTLPHFAAREAERVKRAVAEQGSAVFAYGEGIAVEVVRDEYLDATAHLVDRVVGRVRRALERPGPPPAAMVVSGGAARLPSVREALTDLAAAAGVEYLDWDAIGLPGSATTAVALGAARLPQPWVEATARARRPVTLERAALSPGVGQPVAVPGGLALSTSEPAGLHSGGTGPAFVVRRSAGGHYDDRLVFRPRGVASLGYDPCGDRLVAVALDGSVCVWQFDERRPLTSHSVHWRDRTPPSGAVLAVAARGRRVAWADATGTVLLVSSDWRPARLGFAVHRLAFGTPQHLLAAGADRIALVDADTGATTDELALPGLARSAVALAAQDALVLTAVGRRLQCHDCSGGRFTPLWEHPALLAPALAVVRLDGAPVLVAYDAAVRVYRALDARTGAQLALKDAEHAAEPVELLADGRTGVAYPRHADGRLSVLGFAQARS
ncbi:Hsp70 family protein [Kitasatospora sp. LaBMicrA B282]|uniref:Hsp70 family protein n=1 Tax=Kitasatospora sp. LaBMicrA B282 TaxID=3420949 RepID=UPI003D0C8362